MHHRKIWETHFGAIPKDKFGRTYEIHHIDGNHSNNDINNLKCVSIQEHYDMHYNQGDYGACVLIAKRMSLPTTYLSDIQRGKKRPGIGGVKKGTVPWNKGIAGYKLNSEKKKNKQSSSKLTHSQVLEIRSLYDQFFPIDGVGEIQKNGRPLSYLQAFCKKQSNIYNVSTQCLKKIILKETWSDNVQIKHKI